MHGPTLVLMTACTDISFSMNRVQWDTHDCISAKILGKKKFQECCYLLEVMHLSVITISLANYFLESLERTASKMQQSCTIGTVCYYSSLTTVFSPKETVKLFSSPAPTLRKIQCVVHVTMYLIMVLVISTGREPKTRRRDIIVLSFCPPLPQVSFIHHVPACQYSVRSLYQCSTRKLEDRIRPVQTPFKIFKSPICCIHPFNMTQNQVVICKYIPLLFNIIPCTSTAEVAREITVTPFSGTLL